MNVQEQIDFIKTELARALGQTIGGPVEATAVKRVLADELHHLLGLPSDDPWLDRLAGVLAIDWADIPEGADPRHDLEGVPTTLLDEVVGRLHSTIAGAAGLIMLEWQRRHGHIVDWSFVRIDATSAATSVSLTHPIQRIALDVELKET